MDVQASASSSAAYPRWVMFEQSGRSKIDDEYSSGDVRTLAVALTTAGHPIQVSLRLAEPPAASCVCLHVQLPDDDDSDFVYPKVIAAHDDSLLIRIQDLLEDDSATDYVIYKAGTASLPPSLLLLPPCSIAEESSGPHQSRELIRYATGLIRRGEDELVVAELKLLEEEEEASTNMPPGLVTPELLLFRSGEWIVKRPRVTHGGREFIKLPLRSNNETIVVPIGDRQLCWVSLSTGVLICDVFEENPVLHYVELPMDPCYGEPETNRNVCVTSGGCALKFVNVYPRCCCGGAGGTGCLRSHGAYVIGTWTLRMSDMEWVKDGMVDAMELWALDAYKGLPRVPLDHPVVSMNEPYIICFVLLETNDRTYDRRAWMLMVDTRGKTLRSVLPLDPGEPTWDPSEVLIASNVSYYFNSNAQKSQMDMERSPVQVRDDDEEDNEYETKSSSAEPAVQASEILAALEEIPSYGLDVYDMWKLAYRILSQGDGRPFRPLLNLPKDLRKDWLLMEIKVSDLDPSANTIT